ncbi:hypothetical protein ACIRRI_40650, partial [Streptomyces mirabilis]
RCGESRTPGAASGSGKRVDRKVSTAPRPDSTGRFYPSALVPSLKGIDQYLMRWAVQKYKRLRRRRSRAWQGLDKTAKLYPGLFAHWKLLRPRTTG